MSETKRLTVEDLERAMDEAAGRAITVNADGSICVVADARDETIANLQRDLDQAYKWIRYSDIRRDGACSECFPSEQIPSRWKGFVCAWHKAQHADPDSDQDTGTRLTGGGL